MGRFIKSASLSALLVFLVSCGKDEVASSGKIIIGQNDLVKVSNTDERLERVIKSTGIMVLGCTVTHIGDGLAVTAGHCLKDNACHDAKYDVVWGYTEEEKGYMRSKCTEIVDTQFSNSKDYAVLRYSPAPTVYAEYNMAPQMTNESKITIFSHPKMRTLENSGWCSIRNIVSGTYKFTYQCDTEGGSSGAAILNEDYEVIGVHNLGSYYMNANAGTILAAIPESVL